ncbi:MAG: metal ABC transporter permease [Pseudonocardiaceae bacterium]
MLFDRELALCSGVNADRIVLVLLVVTAVAIGSAIRLTGALLVDALTLLPALGARNLGRSLRSMVIWSIILGLFGNALGFIVALVLDQPLGPVLVLPSGLPPSTSAMRSYRPRSRPPSRSRRRMPWRSCSWPTGLSSPGCR